MQASRPGAAEPPPAVPDGDFDAGIAAREGVDFARASAMAVRARAAAPARDALLLKTLEGHPMHQAMMASHVAPGALEMHTKLRSAEAPAPAAAPLVGGYGRPPVGSALPSSTTWPGQRGAWGGEAGGWGRTRPTGSLTRHSPRRSPRTRSAAAYPRPRPLHPQRALLYEGPPPGRRRSSPARPRRTLSAPA
jgi:hypothetical protein